MTTPSFFTHCREDFNCIFARDPAAAGRISTFFLANGWHAVVFYRAAHRLYNWRLAFVAGLVAMIGRFLTGVEIHPAAEIGRRFFIDHGMGIVIGATTVIDDDCSLYQGVTLGGTQFQAGKRHPTLGHGVVVGAGAKILGPITIGDGAKIGSNAVAVRDVPKGATLVGVPGRLVSEQSRAKAAKTALSKRLDSVQEHAEAQEHPNAQNTQASKDIQKNIQQQTTTETFSAYAVSADNPDPETEAIHYLWDTLQTMETEINRLRKKIATMEGKTFQKKTICDASGPFGEVRDTDNKGNSPTDTEGTKSHPLP